MMTEPDLVTLGDGACIDDASIIGHLNAKGEFSLNRLQLDEFATLRSQSRLLSGAAMEAQSRLLEHTLVYSGEVCQAGSTWQGWPSKCVGWTLLEDAECAGTIGTGTRMKERIVERNDQNNVSLTPHCGARALLF